MSIEPISAYAMAILQQIDMETLQSDRGLVYNLPRHALNENNSTNEQRYITTVQHTVFKGSLNAMSALIAHFHFLETINYSFGRAVCIVNK